MSKLWELKNAMGERNRLAVRAAMEKLGVDASGKDIAAEAGVNYQTAMKHVLAIRGKVRGKRKADPKLKAQTAMATTRDRNRAAVAEAYERLGRDATIRAISEATGLSKATVGDHMKAIAGDRLAERRAAVEAKRAAVLAAMEKLGPGANRQRIANEAGVPWTAAAHYIRGIVSPESLGGATDAEIAERIAASKAQRPPLIPIRRARTALTLAEAAVRDYIAARRSLKQGVASYSLLSDRPA